MIAGSFNYKLHTNQLLILGVALVLQGIVCIDMKFISLYGVWVIENFSHFSVKAKDRLESGDKSSVLKLFLYATAQKRTKKNTLIIQRLFIKFTNKKVYLYK